MVNFFYTSDFITMNAIDLSCKVTSTTSNEVIPPQTTEVTSTTSNEANPPYSPHHHQTGINTNMTTCVLYQNRLIKIPTGLRLKQPKFYLCHKLITVPSGLNLQVPKVHVWDYTKSPEMNFNIGLCSSQHFYIFNIHARNKHLHTLLATSDWKFTDAQHCETLCLQTIIELIG